MTEDQLKPLSEEIERIVQKMKDRDDQIQLLAIQQKADETHLKVLKNGLAKLSGKPE